MTKTILTEDEKRVIEKLGDSLYTVAYVEDWVNQNVTVDINAPAALSKATVLGFLTAVRCIVKNTNNLKSEV